MLKISSDTKIETANTFQSKNKDILIYLLVFKNASKTISNKIVKCYEYEKINIIIVLLSIFCIGCQIHCSEFSTHLNYIL